MAMSTACMATTRHVLAPSSSLLGWRPQASLVCPQDLLSSMQSRRMSAGLLGKLWYPVLAVPPTQPEASQRQCSAQP